MKLRDKVIVVTGGASGIGARPCRRFAAEGARGVVVADRDADGADASRREIGGLAITADVSREADVVRLVEQATAAYGPDRPLLLQRRHRARRAASTRPTTDGSGSGT